MFKAPYSPLHRGFMNGRVSVNTDHECECGHTPLHLRHDLRKPSRFLSLYNAKLDTECLHFAATNERRTVVRNFAKSNKQTNFSRNSAMLQWRNTVGVWTVLIACILPICLAQSRSMEDRASQERYLRQFDHLGERNPDPAMQQLRDHPDRQFAMAIRNFQRFAGLNVTGVVDNATIRMMEMPRCGVSDMVGKGSVMRRRKKRYATVSGYRWRKSHLTYRFLGYTSDLQRNVVRSVFQRAFQIWSEVSTLTFSETTAVSDIEINFASYSHGDNNPFDGPGSTLAHAFFPGEGIGGDAHFDESETWTVNTRQGTNLLQVAVHEIGHSLGLGHSDVQSAVMAPFYQGYDPNFRLDQDDIDGIRYLYGQPAARTSPAPTTTRTTRRVPQTPPRTRPTPNVGGTTTTTSRPTTTTRRSVPSSTFSSCPLSTFCRDLDAIEVIDGVIHAFKGAHYARLSNDGGIISVHRIRDTWPHLPSNLDAVMATDYYVYFFRGREYWRMDKRRRYWVYRQIRHWFRGVPDSIAAAFVWGGNGRIYFIKGDQYYRFNYYYGSIDWGYPRPLSVWSGVQYPVNDAFQHPSGVTYFFSGVGFQRFDDRTITAGRVQSTSTWTQCCSRRLSLVDSNSNSTSSNSTTPQYSSTVNGTGLLNSTATSPVADVSSTTPYDSGSAAFCPGLRHSLVVSALLVLVSSLFTSC